MNQNVYIYTRSDTYFCHCKLRYVAGLYKYSLPVAEQRFSQPATRECFLVSQAFRRARDRHTNSGTSVAIFLNKKVTVCILFLQCIHNDMELNSK